MYLLMIISLLVILPSASLCTDIVVHHSNLSVLPLIGRWWTFWAVGIRLMIAGLRQVIEPRFTAQEIFGIDDTASFPLVREIGFANLTFGTLGICSLFRVDWTAPAGIAGGLYYGLAGLVHVVQRRKNLKEWVAMISDLFVCSLLAVFICQALF